MTIDTAVAEPTTAHVTPAPRGRRRGRLAFVNLAAAVVVTAGVLYAAFMPAGPLPALGPAFNPVTGAWTMAADAQDTDRTVKLAGLEQPVTVLLERDGTAHITAQSDHDLFLSTGYVHARFRLFQMDLLRRQGAGRLSEIVGKDALDTDRFELQLGLLRTAQAEWKALPTDDPSRAALLAYAQGVNDRISEAEATHQLDAMFTLLGYEPRPWTPVDSLLVKGDMTQTLSFNDVPIEMALLSKSLGADLAADWFPVMPPNAQSPYDPGPYAAHAPAPIAATAEVGHAEAQTASALYQKIASLPASLFETNGASNNWAVSGSKSASGGALLAGDPHLHLTLPSIWFQLTTDSPNYHTAGVSIPGTPVVLLGHNQHIAWSLTNGENQQIFYYQEKEDAAHPDQYFWKGTWNKYQTVGYDIPVLGGATQHITVKLSVHGPVISDRGLTTTVWWAGNIPSQDLGVMLRVGQSAGWQDFRNALRGWYSPTQNFVYADDQGNIGLISAGYYPQVAKGQPWLPMSGTGEYDVAGTIPYDDIPQVYNPKDGIIWSANQRQVTADYPYYIGTALHFANGYRANEIHRVLSAPGKLSATDMQALQTDTRDYLASEIVPVLLQTLSQSQLSATEGAAADVLRDWTSYRMDADSSAATIWSWFWSSYVDEVFGPWWRSRAVGVDINEVFETLGQDLEAWTLGDRTNRTFSAPGVGARTAVEAQQAAFRDAITLLTRSLGPDPRKWSWGRVHQRELVNLAAGSLSYGPRPDRGDANTPLAAPDFPSSDGPSWRMVVDWGTHNFQGVYPGGQSENPASTWYDNHVDTWWDGLLNPMLNAGAAAGTSGVKTWSMQP
ncbi:MAG TPA: penicillin acylase family protein [Candidatus Dormibacteraeota bacterium]|nr:penicillin acylase family protein [Candidatus Dormibacteraeota bacterium]